VQKIEGTNTSIKRFVKQVAPIKAIKAADWSMHVLNRTSPLWMNW